MNTYSISCKDFRKCSCTIPVWHTGEIFWTLQFPLDHQLCLPPSCYKYQRWYSRGVRWPFERLRARIWQNQEWNPRFLTLIFSRSETSSPGGTLKVSQMIISLSEQATESCCRPGSRSVKSCFWSLGLKINVQDKLGKRERNWWNGDRRKQRPLQLFSHEVNKTLDQNITRNRKERVDPREFSKKQSDIGVMKIESKRQRQTWLS